MAFMTRVGGRNPFCPFVRIDGSPAPMTKKQPFGGFGTPRPGQAVYGRKGREDGDVEEVGN